MPPKSSKRIKQLQLELQLHDNYCEPCAKALWNSKLEWRGILSCSLCIYAWLGVCPCSFSPLSGFHVERFMHWVAASPGVSVLQEELEGFGGGVSGWCSWKRAISVVNLALFTIIRTVNLKKDWKGTASENLLNRTAKRILPPNPK